MARNRNLSCFANQEANAIPSKSRRRPASVATLMVLLCLCGQMESRGDELGLTNIAQGKPYTFSTPPNYRLCTDAGDAKQLTDGVASGCNWTKKTSVGWQSIREFPAIEIDLGSRQQVGRIRIHSSFRKDVGVSLPEQIIAMLSDDGINFKIACAFDDLRPENQSANKKKIIPHVFETDRINVAGRFLNIVIVPKGNYTFVDEIEVFPSKENAEVRQESQYRVARSPDIIPIIAEHRKLVSLKKSIFEFYDHVQSQISDSNQPWIERTRILNDQVRSLRVSDQDSRHAVLNRFRQLRSEWLSTNSTEQIVWRQADTTIQSSPDDVYWIRDDDSDSIQVALWQNEHESAVVTLANCSSSSAVLSISLSPLRSGSGETLRSEDFITLRQVVNVDALGKGIVGDALPKLSDRRVVIPAGSSIQIWLDFFSPILDEGEYQFALSIDSQFEGSNFTNKTVIQGFAKVHPIRIPDRATLLTMTYAYLGRYPYQPRQMARVARDLHQNYVNLYVIPIEDLPRGMPLSSGKMQMDYRRHDAAIARYPHAREYLFFWGYVPSTKSKRGYRHHWGPWMSSQWKAAMGSYITNWTEHLKTNGIGYDRFAMYPYDESLCPEFAELAKFIKSVDPKIRIFANSPGRKGSSELDQIAPYIDFWCLPENRSQSHLARMRLSKSNAVKLMRYDCQGDCKSLSPLHYYRLQPWRSWQAGDVGSAYWTYFAPPRDPMRSGWDDIENMGARWDAVYASDLAPVDCGDELLVPSRRLRAWRDGIEDYEYLHTLQQRLRALEDKSGTPNRKVRREVNKTVRQVLGTHSGSAAVMDARSRITQEILKLDSRLLSDGRRTP